MSPNLFKCSFEPFRRDSSILLLLMRVTLCLRHNFSNKLLKWSILLEWTLPSYLLTTFETAIFSVWLLTSLMRSSISFVTVSTSAWGKSFEMSFGCYTSKKLQFIIPLLNSGSTFNIRNKSVV